MPVGQIVVLCLQLLLEFFKIFWLIYQKWAVWNEKERELFSERMQTWTSALNVVLKNQREVFDEEAYLKILDTEKQLRYKIYKERSYQLLLDCAGIDTFCNEPKAGMGLRVIKIKTNIMDILKLEVNIEEKSKYISQKLIEVVL